jgi:[ribosomal protein S5]-alanine N-acetyltransferase
MRPRLDDALCDRAPRRQRPPKVWGRGIARAVCDALTRWAFEHVGLQRVQGTTLVSNIRSQRVLEACAFEREGLLRRYPMVRGTPGDFWMYARLS